MIGALLLAAAAATAPARPSVVLVTLDTTRADHLGCYGSTRALTPNIDAIARSGVRFENALSPVPLTLPAHTSLLTGLVPRRHGVRDNAGFKLDAKVPLLTERLKSAGYETAAFVSAAVLDRAGGLARGFTTYDDGVRIGDKLAFNYEERAASQTMEAVLPRLAELKAPFFLWVHFYDPHLPYVPPKPYAARFKEQPYDGEIAFMDAQLGRLMDALKRKGTPLVVAVAGDHGESLGEHGEATHGIFVYQATQHVPLILRGPGLPAGTSVRACVGLVDVAPTILDLLGLPALPATDGRSLKGLMAGAKEPAREYEMESYYPSFAYGWAALRALVSYPFKFIDAPRHELYELPTDPGEKRDLVKARAPRAAEMAASLDARAGALTVLQAANDPDTQERREKLASLGYVGGSSTAAIGGLDPKDGVRLLPDLEAARRSIQLGPATDAVPPLERILAKNPGNIPALLLLGQAQLSAGKNDEAVATYRKVSATAPGNNLAWFDLGNAYATTAVKDDAAFASAKAAWDKALDLAPRHADTYLNYASLLATRGQPEEARQMLLKARAHDVADPTIETELGMLEVARRDTAAGKAALERAIALNPGQVEALEALGKLTYAAEDYKSAAGFYGRALAEKPRPDLAKTLGAIRLYQLGDKPGAKAAFEQALTLSPPGDPDVADLRALIAELSK
ncbi:MAG TPA: sulfatase-like hydrolase/transferase [Candidatus Polarisedimenticolaceae bacterium]|nr:sulfatase-like hydrolase/transferase [Candidatus Polarisedimenticolaceae bacterium]